MSSAALVLQAVLKTILTILSVPHPTGLLWWEMANTRDIMQEQPEMGEKQSESYTLEGPSSNANSQVQH